MAIILIFILLLVILSGVLLLNIRLDETIQSFNFKNSISQRLDYWQAAFKIIHKFPFTGVGIGNFNIAYTKFKTALSNETYHAHNTFLQIFSEVGFLGFLSLALLLFYVLKTGLSKIKDSKAKNLEIGILVAALTFLIRNLFDYDFYVPELSSLFWICLGLLTPAMKFKKTPRNINILFAIVIIPTLLLQILNSLSLHYLKSSYRLTLNKEYKRSVSILEKAATIMPINSTVHNRLAKGYESSILEKGDPYFKKAILEHEKAISLSPHSAYNHRDIGLLLLNYGIKDRANHHLRKALKLYPTNMEFRIHLQETGN